MAVKLYVGGLSYSTTSEALREHFAQCGTVESATVITDRYSGQSRGFGFVEMASNEDAQKAVSMLNGQRLDGRTIKVELANPQGAGGGGGQSSLRRPLSRATGSGEESAHPGGARDGPPAGFAQAGSRGCVERSAPGAARPPARPPAARRNGRRVIDPLAARPVDCAGLRSKSR